MMRRAILLATSLLAAACAAPEQDRWSKGGHSAAQFEQDSGRCRELAQALVGDIGTEDFRGVRHKLALRDRLYASCLEELGYRRGRGRGAGGRDPSPGEGAPSGLKRWDGAPATTKT